MKRSKGVPTESQRAVVSFLRGALARLDGAPSVEVIETHISLVLVARTLVWKLQKAVRRPYLDFSTAELRLACCERAPEPNRRTAEAKSRRSAEHTSEPQSLMQKSKPVFSL